jgi:broad specificity phosphatase PhoE
VARLILLRSAATAATLRAAFPDDEPLATGGERHAGALASVPSLQRAGRALTSPALRARQTAAAALSLDATVDAALADADPGTWRGLTLDEVATRDPKRLADWLEDPDARPPGGESRRDLLTRVGACLDGLHSHILGGDSNGDEDQGGDGTGAARGATVAVTHSGWVRAAVLLVLGAPPTAFWRIDIAPASLTVLHRRERGWALARVSWTAT